MRPSDPLPQMVQRLLLELPAWARHPSFDRTMWFSHALQAPLPSNPAASSTHSPGCHIVPRPRAACGS